MKLLLPLLFFTLFSFATVTPYDTVLNTPNKTEIVHENNNSSEVSTTNKDENPGILFWISCLIAGTLPWVFIYIMKQKKNK